MRRDTGDSSTFLSGGPVLAEDVVLGLLPLAPSEDPSILLGFGPDADVACGLGEGAICGAGALAAGADGGSTFIKSPGTMPRL